MVVGLSAARRRAPDRHPKWERSEVKLNLGVKVLIVIICALVSIIVGIVAGLISHKTNTPMGPAFLFGGGAFAGSLTLCLLVMSSLGVL
ncbi:hypothetical protein [Streptomyces sp. Agncl-13]|uniref:hypothetical protein n=1 Tax=Streptomyces sp. Agncl-13 TaxID=3400628 RepID=UPI003A8622C7